MVGSMPAARHDVLHLTIVYSQELPQRTQWALFCRTHLASGVDRANAAAWELRDLNITSNIRRASARAPGKRMLVIIGASHKPFLDAYLRALIDVKLLQLSDV